MGGGWYHVDIRVLSGAEQVALRRVEKIGAGEVFITAGQSNSCNSGNIPQFPRDDRISAWTGSGWQHADDPQPIGCGTGGSP
jgi:hypothetical protein